MTAISVANEILKEDYGADGIPNLCYTDNPGFGMTTKEKFTGIYRRWPVQYGYASNRSHTTTTALNKTNTTQYAQFEVPTVGDYDAKDIAKKILEEAESPNAFVSLLRNVSDSVVQALSNRLGDEFYGNRGGALGQVGSGQGTTVITLKDPSTITRFAVGQTIAAATTNGLTGALETGTVLITAVDRSAGTITAAANWTTGIATLAANDFLFAAGDFGIARAGLADWVPDDLNRASLSTAFYAAVRNVDSSRLAGTAQQVSGLPISQAIRQVAAAAGREEGKPDTVFLSYLTYNDLITERDIKVLGPVQASAKGGRGEETTVGFSGVSIIGSRGKLDLYPDRSCDDAHFYMCKIDEALCIHSQDAPVKIEDEDGAILARNPTDFTFDIRGQSLANYCFLKPVNLAVGRF